MEQGFEQKMNERFSSWGAAAKKIGLIYMIFERIFYFLGFTSLLNIRYFISRKAYGQPTGKTSAISKDIFKLIFFTFFGIILPVWLLNKQNPELTDSANYIGYSAIFLLVVVLQHNVNVTIFDSFRGRRLNTPRKGKNCWVKVDKAFSILLPTDQSAQVIKNIGYSLTSGQRRVLLAVMDFWLIFVGFSMLYFSLIPNAFSKCLLHFYDALYFTVVTGTTLGFGEITPTTPLSKTLIVIQTLICFVFALIIISNTVSFLPRPDKEEE
jgi:hypothetical protein